MDDEKCRYCKYIAELYTPPSFGIPARYEYCCTLFLREGSVMSLGIDIDHMCECFVSKHERVVKGES